MDALIQTEQATALQATVLTPLAAEEAAARALRAAKAAATKVEFFTLVRGEDIHPRARRRQTTPEALLGGFRAAPTQSARAFRAALEAMARPGTIWTVEGARPPQPMSTAAGLLLLTLCDGITPLHLGPSLNQPVVRDWVTFHTRAPLVAAEDARFAVGNWGDLTPVSRFAIGLPDCPDRSATLIVEMPVLMAAGACLTGPGIRDAAHLNLPETQAFRANRALFPQGFDTYLTCGARLAGLPRSTSVEAV